MRAYAFCRPQGIQRSWTRVYSPPWYGSPALAAGLGAGIRLRKVVCHESLHALTLFVNLHQPSAPHYLVHITYHGSLSPQAELGK